MIKFVRLPLFFLSCLLLYPNYCKADLILSSFGDIEYTAGAALAPLTFTVHDSDTSSPDGLVGWQLSLRVIADAGATGNVSFVSAAEPSDYLLSGVNLGIDATLSSTDFTNDGILVNDLDASLFGVLVPGAPTNLVDIALTASAGASGTFRLVAFPGATATAFADIALDEVEFDNVPFRGGPVTLATFSTSAAVPEPGSATVFGLIAVSACFRWRRK